MSTARIAKFLITLSLLLFIATQAHAQQNTFTMLNGPGSGRILYGQIHNESTEAGAMGYALHALHEQFGDKPQVGKLFEVRGTQSVACFFTLNKKLRGTGQIAGMIIAAKATTEHVEAAVVYDDATQLKTSLSPMLTTLMKSWHPLEAARAMGGASGGTPAAPLKRFVLQDRSAWMGVPEGWNVSPQSGGGTIIVAGPNGENVAMGLAFLAMDTNNPSVRQTMAVIQRGGLRGTSYASANYVAYGGNLANTFVQLVQLTRKKNNMQPAAINITEASPFPSQPPARCVHLLGTIDAQDGKGSREMNTVYCTTPPAQMGSWLSTAYHTAIPAGVADKERATVGAMMQSFGEDMNVISREAAIIAGPAIEQIHAIGRAADARIKAAHEAQDIQRSSVYEHWDSMDKRSQAFENYQLGYSVVNDIPNNAHGTLWNQDADWLVKHDPQRFEYVNTPDYWKGIDY